MAEKRAADKKLQKENDEVEAVAWRTLQEIEDDAKGVFASHMSFFKIAERKMQELMPPSLKRSLTFVPDDDMKRFKTESVNSFSTRFHNIGMHAAYPFARR